MMRKRLRKKLAKQQSFVTVDLASESSWTAIASFQRVSDAEHFMQSIRQATEDTLAALHVSAMLGTSAAPMFTTNLTMETVRSAAAGFREQWDHTLWHQYLTRRDQYQPDRTVEARARSLLRRHLSDSQRREFDETNCFTVVSRGEKYRLNTNGTYRYRDGCSFCAVDPETHPFDQMLQRKLLLENDPQEFFSVAVKSLSYSQDRPIRPYAQHWPENDFNRDRLVDHLCSRFGFRREDGFIFRCFDDPHSTDRVLQGEIMLPNGERCHVETRISRSAMCDAVYPDGLNQEVMTELFATLARRRDRRQRELNGIVPNDLRV